MHRAQLDEQGSREAGGESIGADERDTAMALEIDRCDAHAVCFDSERDVERSEIGRSALPEPAATAGRIADGVDDEARLRGRRRRRTLKGHGSVVGRCRQAAPVGNDRWRFELEQAPTHVEPTSRPLEFAVEEQVAEGRGVDPERAADVRPRNDRDRAVRVDREFERGGLDRSGLHLAGMEPAGAADAVSARVQCADDAGAASGHLDEADARTRFGSVGRLRDGRPGVDERPDHEVEVGHEA